MRTDNYIFYIISSFFKKNFLKITKIVNLLAIVYELLHLGKILKENKTKIYLV